MADSFEDIKKRIAELNKYVGISEKEINYLITPKKIITVDIRLKREGSDKIDTLKGYRVQFNDALGPTKGGIRFHPGVDLDEVKSLAFWMTLKCSLTGLPYGGAKGGVCVDPKGLSRAELEIISRAFIKGIASHIGSHKDIPAPDVYTDQQVMAWMLDEYEKTIGEHQPGVITGKPIILGGSKGRDSSTAQGGAYVLLAAMEKLDIDPFNSRVAVQGFGNVGMNIARILQKNGLKIIAVSDSKGGVFNQNGLDIEKLAEYKDKYDSVAGFSGSEVITNEEILELDTDILVPAALSNVITAENAGKVKAKIIIELANGPVTSEADKILHKNDVLLIPDVLANSGGVIVSYYEWVQNNIGDYWSESEVFSKLKQRILSAFENLYDMMREKDIDLRTAAYAVAVERVITAARLRGRI